MASRALTPKQTPKWFVGKDPLGDGLVETADGLERVGEVAVRLGVLVVVLLAECLA